MIRTIEPHQIQPYDRFSVEHSLSEQEVSRLAYTLGDENPVHHDAKYVARTKYKKLVASGAHTTGLLLGLVATQFSHDKEMVGLEFSANFRHPVFANERIKIEWLVIRVEHKPKLNGDIIELRGRILSQSGHTCVGAKGKVLVISLDKQL